VARVVDPPDQLWSLQIVLETIPHIVWIADADGRAEYFNRKGVAFTGLQSDETSGWGWLTIVHPDDAERARSRWKHAQHTATSMAVDYRVRRADGEYRWVSSLAEPIVDAAGAVIRWVGTWSDIQAERELQERLRDTAAAAAESVALVSALESMAPVGFGFVDRDFRVTQIHDEIARLHGLVPQAAVGRRVEELVPEDWPRLEPVYRRVLDGGERVTNVEVVKTNVHGDTRQWLLTYYLVRAGDDIAGLGFVGIDITSWRRADVLRAAVTESMVEGLYALDPGGRLTFMNPAASRMLGWPEDELRGHDMDATFFPHGNATFMA
jgi:PAS domain S-box-containing protein